MVKIYGEGLDDGTSKKNNFQAAHARKNFEILQKLFLKRIMEKSCI